MGRFSLFDLARRATMPAVRMMTLLVMSAALVIGARAAHAANPQVNLSVAGKGVITIELYQKEAPKTVEHFLKLVNAKFYDGILFHRVIKGFMAQTGDPNSIGVDGSKLRDLTDQQVGATYHLGTGGSGENIPFEKNKLSNERGTLAMALSAPQSATGDSQFFINFVPNTRLNGDYCVFGKVVKGLDVVDKIQQGDRISSIRVISSSSKPAKGKKK
jgi:cyclophilin family peptidyl-prolyl cis-trans isomerase